MTNTIELPESVFKLKTVIFSPAKVFKRLDELSKCKCIKHQIFLNRFVDLYVYNCNKYNQSPVESKLYSVN